MRDIDVEIEAKTSTDVEILIEILKKQFLTTPVYLIRSTQSFYLRYNIDYETDQVESDVEKVIEGYRFSEHFNIWDAGIRMIIRKITHPTSDGWGRQHEGSDKTMYLVPDKLQEKKVDHNFQVLFGDTLKDYRIEISPGMNPQTQQRGFLIIDSNVDEQGEKQILVNKLFDSTNAAFWEGLRMRENEIQLEFEEHRKKAKRKSRSKKPKEN